jgi:hypothetical protein
MPLIWQMGENFYYSLHNSHCSIPVVSNSLPSTDLNDVLIICDRYILHIVMNTQIILGVDAVRFYYHIRLCISTTKCPFPAFFGYFRRILYKSQNFMVELGFFLPFVLVARNKF